MKSRVKFTLQCTLNWMPSPVPVKVPFLAQAPSALNHLGQQISRNGLIKSNPCFLSLSRHLIWAHQQNFQTRPHDKFAVGIMKVNYPSSCCHNPRRLKHYYYSLAPSHFQLIILGSIGTHAFKCNGAFHFSSSNKNLQRRVFEQAFSFSTCMYRCFPTSLRHSSENERSDGWYMSFN